jgi:hypothetical protein
VLLLRHDPFGYGTAVGQLVFLGLTSLPIVATPIIAAERGRDADWSAVGPVATLFVIILVLLWRTLRQVDEAGPRPVSANPDDG